MFDSTNLCLKNVYGVKRVWISGKEKVPVNKAHADDI